MRVLFAAAAVAALAAQGPFLAAAEKPPQNLFANPSFENGREEWRLDKAGKTAAAFKVDQADAKDGGSSALVAIDSPVEEWGVQFGQSFEGGTRGKTYTFAALAKAVKGPVKVRLEIERSGKPYDRAARSEEVTLAPGAWKEIHVTFKVDKDFREGWFAYVSCTQPGAQFRLDMVRLCEGEYVPYEKAAREEARGSGVSVFDTGAASAAPLPGEALAKKAGWTAVPEDKTAHAFKGDAVLANDRLALVLRSRGPGAEVYAAGPQGWTPRAVLAPAAGGGPLRVQAVAIVKNSPSRAAVSAAFASADGKKSGLGLELDMGQVFVKTEPRDGTAVLAVGAPSRFAVLPDFFADDIVVDAAEIPVPVAELPGENFLLQMLGGGEAILMAVSADRGEDFRIALAGQGAGRTITRSEIPYGKSGKTWVAVLDAPGVWHRRDIAREDTGKVLDLDWKAPFAAQWRMDWRKADRLVDSWEVIAQRSGGDFEKPGLFGSPSTIPANRKRWTTVLGSFPYPCWLDQGGQGHIQPLKSAVVRFEGPALVYPINRVKATPLGVFTMADIARATLGVGPCEYILDVEGQGGQYKGRATCATRDALRPIYEARQQKAKRAEIEKALDEVMVFVRHIRGRIETYVDFGHKTLAYLEEQKKAHPDLAPFVAEMTPVCKAIDGYVEKRKSEIKTVDYTQAMVDQFRNTVIDYEGDDAYAKCKKFTEDLVQIGGSQDELAGECRMAVKIIRQRAALAAATDPRAADVAREIRNRTQQVLRNPAGHEGARH